MSRRETVRLAVSLDVEEEGLFSGHYAQRTPSVNNTASLQRLVPLMRLPLRLTLFCAYSVLRNPEACADICAFWDKFKDRVEIGAHLHHWNTPPLSEDITEFTTCVSAADIPEDIFAAKLGVLLDMAESSCGCKPASFRMGRWDIRRSHWSALAAAGISGDASVRPLHDSASGPDHFYAPGNPYRIPVADREILEIPLTVTPLWSGLPNLLRSLPVKSCFGDKIRTGFKNWGALALLPVYHPLWLMQLVTRLFVARGGKVLSLTWHSSEMMPGGTPHVPDLAAVDALLDKIYHYLQWIYEYFSVHACTMRELVAELTPQSPVQTASVGDWSCE